MVLNTSGMHFRDSEECLGKTGLGPEKQFRIGIFILR